MKNLLIIYPHWHPANLAGVHRPRLVGNYLPDFGWSVRVLTVEEQYFEESPDLDFHKTFSADFQVSRVPAKKIRKPRIIGDIGLRAMNNIRKKALEIIREESIDFIWIPIPSFYMALVGPYLYKRTGVPYGIDYIDPWVRDLTNQRNFRAVLSQWVARMLEPKAVRDAALITGVNKKYYEAVIERNNLRERTPAVVDADFPYGFDPHDHEIKLEDITYPWEKHPARKIWLYTGAFLPNSHYFLESLFKAIAALRRSQPGLLENHLFCFLGTGPYPAKRITAYADDHGIGEMVMEIRDRFPYLHTLNFQAAADTMMIIGSTEKHYTASKTYQSLLSKRPLFSIFHRESQAMEVLSECKADQYTIAWDEEMSSSGLEDLIRDTLIRRLQENTWAPELKNLEKYSARESARTLATAMESAIRVYKNDPQ